MESIQVIEYFSNLPRLPVIDVRSPAEFQKGHIPDAVNLPLFNNNERAEIGTLYKQSGKQKSVKRGLTIVGNKMAQLVEEAESLAPSKGAIIQCWRGGMRSASFSSLLNFLGWKTSTMQGGYKAFRRMVLNHFETTTLKLIVLGGKTGSGKTDLLKMLSGYGEQVIDLEDLANHKGSSFGSFGEQPQPTVEQFENNLFDALSRLNPNKRIWVENESRSIGRVFIPMGLWNQMCNALYIGLKVPFEERVERLVKAYGIYPNEQIIEAFYKIHKRMGGQHVKSAVEAVRNNQPEEAAQIALSYYDKAYEHATAKKDFKRLIYLDSNNMIFNSTVNDLIKIADEYFG